MTFRTPMSTNPILRTSPVRRFLWAAILLASTITTVQAEDEFGSGGGGWYYGDSGGSGGGYYGEVVVLPPFVVDGNDPATFDYEGWMRYEIAQDIEDRCDAVNGVVNENGYWGLIPEGAQGAGAVGWVESDGNDSYVVRMNLTDLQPKYQSPEVIGIIEASVEAHEKKHAEDAKANNPEVFDTNLDGRVLASSEGRQASEAAAYQVQLDSINAALAAGGLSATATETLQDFAQEIRTEIQNNGGTPNG
jgi:hypothetical protein